MKKYKQSTSKVYGYHAVLTLLKNNPENIDELLINSNRKDQRCVEVKQFADFAGIAVSSVDKNYLDEATNKAVHQGMLAITKQSNQTFSTLESIIESTKPNKFILVLDQIQDPHNLGACLRTADGAGVDMVILPKDNACPVNETVHKVAAGATQRLSVNYVTNLVRTIGSLKEAGFWVYGTSDSANTPIYQQDLTGNIVLVMGSEGKGMRKLTQSCCDNLVSIPMAGEVSSLNVSVATGVFLFEAVRQRN